MARAESHIVYVASTLVTLLVVIGGVIARKRWTAGRSMRKPPWLLHCPRIPLVRRAAEEINIRRQHLADSRRLPHSGGRLRDSGGPARRPPRTPCRRLRLPRCRWNAPVSPERHRRLCRRPRYLVAGADLRTARLVLAGEVARACRRLEHRVLTVWLILRAPADDRSLWVQWIEGRSRNLQFADHVDAKMFMYIFGGTLLALNAVSSAAYRSVSTARRRT